MRVIDAHHPLWARAARPQPWLDGERLAPLRRDFGPAERGLAVLATEGPVCDLVIQPHQLEAACQAAARHPGVTFVLDRLGKPPIATGPAQPWTDGIRRLAGLPNTVCKLSGLVTEADWRHGTTAGLAPWARTVMDAFGPDLLMFGSDWPVCLLAAEYGQVLAAARELTADLTPAEQALVFAGTAERVYGLPGR